MPLFSDLRTITITAAGGTYVMPNNERIGTYVFDGNGSLLASYAITADLTNTLTAGRPARVKILYKGIWLLNGNNITVFGTALTQGQALSGSVLFDCFYDGSTWTVTVVQNAASQLPVYQGVETTALAAGGGTINLFPGIDNEWQELVLNTTLTSSVTVTGAAMPGKFYIHFTNGGSGVPAGNNVTIFGLALTQQQITNGNVLVLAYFDVPNNVWRAQLVQDPNSQINGQYEVITIPVSFEANGVGYVDVMMPYNCKIVGRGYSVTTTLSGTDVGVATVYNNSVATNAVMNIPLGSVVGANLFSPTSPTTNNVVSAGTPIQVLTSKVTPGGSALITIWVQRLP